MSMLREMKNKGLTEFSNLNENKSNLWIKSDKLMFICVYKNFIKYWIFRLYIFYIKN